MDRRFILGVDLDGVCGDYITALKNFVAADRGISPSDLTDEISWNCPEWDLTETEYEEYHSRAVKEQRLFYTMPMMRGASQALWELSNAGLWIRIITHRLFMSGSHAVVASDTVQWLDNMKIPYWDICFIGGKQDVGANLYIEDNPDNITALRANDLPVLVFDQPYNRDMPGPRAANWEEAKEIVLESFRQYERFHPSLPGLDDGQAKAV